MTTPAPTVEIPGAWSLAITYRMGGQDAVNVLGGIANSPGNPESVSGLTWLNAWWAQLRTYMSNEVECTGALLTMLHDEHVIQGVPAPSNPTGAFNSANDFAAASAVVNWRTSTYGRHARGRTFVPFIPTGFAQANGRQLATISQTQLQTAVNGYRSAIADANVTSGITPAVVSRSRGAAYPITSGVVSPIMGVQRRRMR